MAPEATAAEAPLLVVGKIARVHGLRGEVRVVVIGDDPARLAPGRELWFERGSEAPRLLRVASCRAQPPRLLVKFEGIETPEAAEPLAGGDLSVRFDPSLLSSGEFYAHQLEGLDVVTLDARRVGRVAGVLFAPGRQLLEVREEGRPGTRLVPFHGDIVKAVDLAGRVVTIDPPEGLLDL